MGINSRLWFKRLGLGIGIPIILVVALAATAYVATPWLGRFKPQIEKLASSSFHHPVKIGTVSAAWHGWVPVLEGRNVQILEKDGKHSQLKIHKIKISFDLWESLSQRQLHPDFLLIQGARVTLRQSARGHWRTLELPAATWVLRQGKFLLNDIVVTQTDKQKHSLTVAINHAALKVHTEASKLLLDIDNSKLTVKGWLMQPLKLRVNGELVAEKSSNGMQLSMEGLSVKHPEGELNGHGKLKWIGKKPLQIEAAAEFSFKDLTKVAAFLPQRGLPKTLHNWLGQAFKHGRAQGSLIWQGGLSSLQAKLQLKAAELLYASDWPSIKAINAKVSFGQNTMAAQIDSAKLSGAALEKVSVVIPKLARTGAKLTVTGEVQGKLKQGLAFLYDSPLQKIFGPVLLDSRASGPMNLHIKVVLPFDDISKKYAVFGHLKTNNARIDWPEHDLSLHDVSAQLDFSRDGLSAKQIKAQFWHHPLIASIQSTPSKTGHLQTKITLQGELNMKKVQRFLPLPLTKYAKGNTKFKGALAFEPGQPHQFSLQTDLQGVVVQLPEPWTKLRSEKVSSRLQLQFGQGKPLFVEGHYGKLAQSALELVRANGSWKIKRGTVVLGGQEPKLPATNILLVTGKMKHLSVKDMLAYVRGRSHTLSLGKTTALQWQLDMLFDQIDLWQQKFRQTRLKVVPSEQAFAVDVEGPQLTGKLTLPRKKGDVIKADLKRLVLAKEAIGKSKSFDPHNIPPLDLQIGAFSYGKTTLGEVMLQLQPEKHSLAIKKFAASTGAYQLTSTGHWWQKKGKSKTALTGKVKLFNLGRALRQWHWPQVINSNDGHIEFTLRWPQAPYDFKLPQAEGRLILTLRNGHIVKLGKSAEEKVGIGKFLNLLSLQTLPRRLHLDFSDVAERGFPFDTLRANISLQEGNAHVASGGLDGSVAQVKVSGRIGLQQKDYDLLLHVSPYVTSSLPVVATIAGGPIAGLVTWVAGKVVREEVHKHVDYRYKLTGPWHAPVVTELPNKQ